MKKKPKEKPPATQLCAAGGCRQPGEYKAPRSRWQTEEYQYLCLEHIREFNRAWDYFEGWSREEIESFTHSLVHGHRPTWKIGSQPLFTNDMLRESFFKMMGEAPPKAPSKPETRAQRKAREALAMLGLETGAMPPAVKSQYKKLVKKYHPDVNKGDKASEEMFKRITAAYTLLSKTYESSHEE
jgi:hypothetical protein